MGLFRNISDSYEDSKLTKSIIFTKWKLIKNLIPKNYLIEVQYEDLINMTNETIDYPKKFTGTSKN